MLRLVTSLISNVISVNQLFASTFLVQIFKFQRCICRLSFQVPPRPPECPGELARRLLWELIQAKNNHVHCTLPSTVDDENGMEYGDESSPSSPTSSKTLPRSASGTTVSSQGTQGGKSKKPFFKKVLTLLYNDYYDYS